eukprot:10932522-Lingulodinium_polyedra.AAC.1
MRKRAINAPLRRRALDSSASLRNVLHTLRNDAIEWTARCRNGAQIARPCTPRARQKTGASTKYASVRFASRCNCAPSIHRIVVQ